MTRPVWIGASVGAALAALGWVGAGDALARLDAARAVAADVRADAAPVDRLANAPWRLRAGSVRGAASAVALRTRRAAKANAVLVERAGMGAAPGTGLARLDLSLSGPEKAVLTVADGIEREGAGARWTKWRLAAAPGGVRLTGSVVIAWAGPAR